MKIILFSFLLFSFVYAKFSIIKDTSEVKNVLEGDENFNTSEISTFAEEMPSFPGGEEELYNFIANNIKYPDLAKKAGITGKVIVEFIVSEDGKIIEPKVVKGIGYGCNEEAIRIIKLMPKWIPGKQDGKPIKVKLLLPIIFSN
jgi:protein TonB